MIVLPTHARDGAHASFHRWFMCFICSYNIFQTYYNFAYFKSRGLQCFLSSYSMYPTNYRVASLHLAVFPTDGGVLPSTASCSKGWKLCQLRSEEWHGRNDAAP